MSEAAPALASAAPSAPTSAEVPVQRWKQGELTSTTDYVTEEMPVSLVYHGVPHVVMLASPADLEDYAVGFTVSEGLVAHPREIQSVEVERGADSIEVRIGIDGERFAELLRRRRNLTGRSGCGLCGAETVEEAIRPPTQVGKGPRVSAADLHAALLQLDSMQPVNARTGSIHAAAWVGATGIQLVREDVGRHNALDKVIGALVRREIDIAAGYAIITSRASFEMIQKAAAAGITFVAAVSAPTGLAIRLAEQSGITLVGFARRDSHVVYAHPERLHQDRIP